MRRQSESLPHVHSEEIGLVNDPRAFIEPLAGYLIDIGNKLRNRIFVPHSLLKLHNLKLVQGLTGAKTVIEIGSYKGVTTLRLSYIFDKVVSVEIDPTLHTHAKQRCEKRQNVEVLYGDGSTLLPKLVQKHDRSVLFLDGHFSGGETGQGATPEPVLQELDGIGDHLDCIDAVVIDDFRLFGEEEGWPCKSEVFAKIEDLFARPEWKIRVHNDQFIVFRYHQPVNERRPL